MAPAMTWLVALVIACTSSTHAQDRRTPAGAAKQLCVDVVSMRPNKAIKGLVIQSQGDQLLMAVRRQWLQKERPELYASAVAAERQLSTEAWSTLAKRLREQLDDDTAPAALRDLYQRELERAARAIAELAEHPDAQLAYRFMWLELKGRDVSGVKRGSPDVQRVAVWSWSQKLGDVESRDQVDLERELADAKIDVKNQPPDLSSQLPPRPQSDEEWGKRLAIATYTFSEPLDFQGAKGVYVRTGAGAEAPDMAPLIGKMLGGDFDSLLEQLDLKPRGAATAASGQIDFWQPIVTQAEQLGSKVFRATRVDLDPTGQSATVETALIAQLEDGAWQRVWSTQQTMLASQVTAEQQREIRDDPQVKNALGLLAALGASAETEIAKAIRFGAATMAAQKAAQLQFFAFRDRYVQRLDGPPLP